MRTIILENARRIVIAEMQNIVYGEYLPVVLGEDAMRDEGIGMHTLIDCSYRLNHIVLRTHIFQFFCITSDGYLQYSKRKLSTMKM